MRDINADFSGSLALGLGDRSHDFAVVELINKFFRFHVFLPTATGTAAAKAAAATGKPAARETAAAAPAPSPAPTTPAASPPPASASPTASVIHRAPPRPRDLSQNDQDYDKPEKSNPEAFVGPASLVDGPTRPFVFASRGLQHGVHTRGESPVIFALLEKRRNLVIHDPFRQRIRQRAFESVTDLDPHPPVLNEHEQHRAVILLLLSDSP